MYVYAAGVGISVRYKRSATYVHSAIVCEIVLLVLQNTLRDIGAERSKKFNLKF